MVVLCLIVSDISETASNTEGNIHCGNFDILSVWVTSHFSFMGIEQAVTLVFDNIFTL